jgi:type I restriction enzyme S subunit
MNKMIATFPKSVQPGIPKLAETPKRWTRYKLGDLFDVVSRPLKMQDDVEYDLVTVKRSRGGIKRRSRLLGRKISVKSQFYLREGDFLISKRQIVHGACGIVSADYDGSIVSNEYAVLKPRDMLLLDYLRYLTHSLYFQQTCFHASIGIHVEKMIFKLEDWFKWEIHLPPLDVQRDIANGLLATDQKLENLGETHTLLTDFKHGLMERIFSQKLRFTDDDSSSFPDWEEHKLGEIFGWVRTNSLSREHLTDSPASGVQNIHYGDIHKKFSALFNHDNEEVPYVKTKAPTGYINDEEFLRVGDIVIADASEDYADIGKTIEVINVRPNAAIAGLHTYLARPKTKSLALGFPGYLLRSNPMRRQIMRIAQGVSVLGVSKGNLEKLTFWLPNLDEQRKIAGSLSAIDAKIDAVSTQIIQMESFKKGLLQKLFV